MPRNFAAGSVDDCLLRQNGKKQDGVDWSGRDTHGVIKRLSVTGKPLMVLNLAIVMERLHRLVVFHPIVSVFMIWQGISGNGLQTGI
jgi:hypothetical protein